MTPYHIPANKAHNFMHLIFLTAILYEVEKSVSQFTVINGFSHHSHLSA